MLLIAAHCLFSAPDGWDVADPKTPCRSALVSFVDTRKSGFCPSLNLTTESLQIPIDDYLKIVEKGCKAKRQKWRWLGSIQTQSGPAELTEIETKTKFGFARIFQAILVHRDEVFILTAAALKKEFGKHALTFDRAIRSMKVCDDLASQVEDPKRRAALLAAWKKREDSIESKAFEKMVLEEFSDMGTVWQLMVVKQ